MRRFRWTSGGFRRVVPSGEGDGWFRHVSSVSLRFRHVVGLSSLVSVWVGWTIVWASFSFKVGLVCFGMCAL
ncbi:unnamed protein product [Brassica oleracea var. botrytis]|uniref:(rape) hypothetical protein n=1 Tax=Brassica napus TaxID=3708 RepID=A0A816JF48_BRANA|nr:unnamed protein product [Brassica napus]